MADEGMEAYFETSPNARALKLAGAGEGHIITAEEMKNESLTEQYSPPPNYQPLVIESENSSHLDKQEAMHIKLFISEVMKSAILTEDDAVLLESVLNIEESSEIETGINLWFKSYGYVYFSLIILTLALLSFYSFYLLLAIFVVAAGFTLLKVKEIKREGRMKEESKGLKGHLSKMESLLNLVMKSLNTIRERELVYHGFSRPLKGLPASRIDSQYSGNRSNNYQCLPLRERLHKLCSKGREMMGGLTVSLIEGYPLNLELDSKETYLVYRDLPTTDEEDDLSLDNLKDAASIMAICNSEMLRRLVLVLGCHLISEQSVIDKDEKRLSLSTAYKMVVPLEAFVSESLAQLKWSLDYQSHQYTTDKDTSTIKSPFKNNKSKNESKGEEDEQLSLIEAELHAADLHVHTTLIKLRELSDDSSGQLWEEEIKSILSNISSAEHHLQQVLSQLHPPPPPPPPPLATSTPNCAEVEDGEEDNEVVPTPEAADDDEEMIYEAYVSSLDQISQLEEQVLVSNEEWKKMSLNILQELESVLSVRKAMKEKKRRRKEMRQSLEETTPEDNIDTNTPPSGDHQITNTLASNHVTSTDKSHDNQVTSTAELSQITKELTAANESHEDHMTTAATNTEESRDQVDYHMESHDHLMQLQFIAKAVAASNKRKQNEEIFELSIEDEED